MSKPMLQRRRADHMVVIEYEDGSINKYKITAERVDGKQICSTNSQANVMNRNEAGSEVHRIYLYRVSIDKYLLVGHGRMHCCEGECANDDSTQQMHVMIPNKLLGMDWPEDSCAEAPKQT
jgi:hypothetical protein